MIDTTQTENPRLHGLPLGVTGIGTLSQMRAMPLPLRFKVPYHWAGRLDHGTSVVLVEVETDKGFKGIAECAAHMPDQAVVSMLHQAWPFFIGQEPFAIDRLFSAVRTATGMGAAGRAGNLVLAGLEMAIWDLIGKAYGLPVCQLLGGTVRDQVDYFGFLQGDTTDELGLDAERAVSEGFNVIYLKVGRGEALDMANVAAVRQVIGGRSLRLDANEAWDAYTAIRMIRKLERFEPDWVEQPTPAHSLEALKHVKESVGVPIAADQAAFTIGDVYEICRRRAANAIVLSPHEAGGILPFKKACAIAEAAGISICLHGRFVSGITDCAQHMVALTVPNLTDGNQIMHQLLVEDVIARPDLTPRGGKLGTLSGPGLGFEVDWDTVSRLTAR